MYVPPAPEPYPNAPVLLSYKFMKDFFTKHHPHLPCPIDDIPTFGEELWRERLEKFTATQEWGLAPLDSPLGRAAGITFSSYNDFIIINPVGIRSVLQGDLTLAECCAARVYTAVTVIFLHGSNLFTPTNDPNRYCTNLVGRHLFLKARTASSPNLTYYYRSASLLLTCLTHMTNFILQCTH